MQQMLIFKEHHVFKDIFHLFLYMLNNTFQEEY